MSFHAKWLTNAILAVFGLFGSNVAALESGSPDIVSCSGLHANRGPCESADSKSECPDGDSFSGLASNLVSCASAAAPDLFESLSREFQLVVSNAMLFSRPGWPSAQLVQFANQGPETNAVLVPLRNVDIHKPGPRTEWKTIYSDDEVQAGIRRNQAARFLVLGYIVESLDDSAEMSIPFSEELMAVAEIWGSDIIQELRGRGMNTCMAHRGVDGIQDVRPLFKMFLVSTKIDSQTRKAAESILGNLNQAPPPASAGHSVPVGVGIGWLAERIVQLSDGQSVAEKDHESIVDIKQ